MNKVVFLPENLQKKKNDRKFYRKIIMVFFMSNILLLLFFCFPYNNLLKLRKENNSLKEKLNMKEGVQTNEYKTKEYNKEQQLLKIVNLINNEKQTIGNDLMIFKNINNETLFVETINYENNRIEIQGKSANYYLIIDLLKFINDCKYYLSARLARVDYLEQSKSFVFKMSIIL